MKCGALTAQEMHALGKRALQASLPARSSIMMGSGWTARNNRRCISADLDSIRAIGKRMMVIQEDSKFEPLVAAIKGGFASHLVVTTSMARRLLERWSTGGRSTS